MSLFKSESGWLIEMFELERHNQPQKSLNLAIGFCSEHNCLKFVVFDEALRFARKQDAEQFLTFIVQNELLWIPDDLKVTEHVWAF